MTRTARRRWSRELTSQIDGIAIAGNGPVLVHGYDQPAGGKWLDDVIPGKLYAVDRGSGEIRWCSPCEVGYGRGFGAGLGPENDAVLLGPGLQGYRIVRMDLETGELLDAREVARFDEALVRPDLSICVSPRRVLGLHTGGMAEVWSYHREGERYHRIARDRERVYVAYTSEALGSQGVLCLSAQTGEPLGRLIEPSQSEIRGLVAEAGVVALLVSEVEDVVPPGGVGSAAANGGSDELPSGAALLALSPTGHGVERPLWCESLSGLMDDELPDIGIAADSGKLYLARGAVLEVRDLLSGRSLGVSTVPGLDDHVAWTISQGAGLLAEETRVSIFEIPD